MGVQISDKISQLTGNTLYCPSAAIRLISSRSGKIFILASSFSCAAVSRIIIRYQSKLRFANLALIRIRQMSTDASISSIFLVVFSDVFCSLHQSKLRFANLL